MYASDDSVPIIPPIPSSFVGLEPVDFLFLLFGFNLIANEATLC